MRGDTLLKYITIYCTGIYNFPTQLLTYLNFVVFYFLRDGYISSGLDKYPDLCIESDQSGRIQKESPYLFGF